MTSHVCSQSCVLNVLTLKIPPEYPNTVSFIIHRQDVPILRSTFFSLETSYFTLILMVRVPYTAAHQHCLSLGSFSSGPLWCGDARHGSFVNSIIFIPIHLLCCRQSGFYMFVVCCLYFLNTIPFTYMLFLGKGTSTHTNVVARSHFGGLLE